MIKVICLLFENKNDFGFVQNISFVVSPEFHVFLLYLGLQALGFLFGTRMDCFCGALLHVM